MKNKALVIIDIQNDITKNYKDIIDNINKSIDWAVKNKIHVIYIRNEYLSEKIRKFKPGTFGAELTDDLNVVNDNIFTKNYGSALSSDEFTDYVEKNGIDEFYLVGADAIACVKTTNNDLIKHEYKVNVLSDCITSYDKKKIGEMLEYYAKKGSNVTTLGEVKA